jgi:acyl-CoA thioester hydrolase
MRRQAVVQVTVEFEDVDAFGIVNHARIVSYLERARLRLLEAVGVPLTGGGPLPVMYDVAVRFRRPARLRDALEVAAEVVEADAWTVSLRYEVRRGGDLLVRGRSRVAFWDPATDAPVPVPDAVAAGLAAAGG